MTKENKLTQILNQIDKLSEDDKSAIIGNLSRKFIIPNWYTKEHVEGVAEEKFSDEQWEFIHDYCTELMPDWMSQEMTEWISIAQIQEDYPEASTK